MRNLWKFFVGAIVGNVLFTFITDKAFTNERVIDILGVSIFSVFFWWLFEMAPVKEKNARVNE